MIWMVTMTVHYFYFGKNENSFKIYLTIFFSMVSFSLGFWLFAGKNFCIRKEHRNEIEYNKKYLMKLLFVFTVIDIIRVLIAVKIIYKLSDGNLSMLITNGTYLRNLYLARKTGVIMAVLSVFTTMNAVAGFVLLGICNALKLKKSRIYLALWTALEFLLCIVTMSKMIFFIYIIIMATAYFNNIGGVRAQKHELKKWLPVTGILILGLLAFIAIQRNYSRENGLLSILLSKALFYFTGPLESLAVFVAENKSEWSAIKNTFWIFVKIFVRLGLTDHISISNHMQVVQTSRGDANVYSWFLPFYQDLSFGGMVIYPFIWGTLAGIFYRTDYNNFLSTAINSFFSCLFAMSFYFFLWGQGSYVYAFFYVLVLNWILRNKLYCRGRKHDKVFSSNCNI